ncbi:MAG: hypothetical protein ABI540_05255 [Spartobacteria bacterium]
MRGGQTEMTLRAHYGGGGLVTFVIVQRPEHGKLSHLRLLGDNRATILYKNDGTQSVTTDAFRYVARTSNDRVSSPAEVRISVEEPPPHLQAPAQIVFEPIMAGDRPVVGLAWLMKVAESLRAA